MEVSTFLEKYKNGIRGFTAVNLAEANLANADLSEIDLGNQSIS